MIEAWEGRSAKIADRWVRMRKFEARTLKALVARGAPSSSVWLAAELGIAPRSVRVFVHFLRKRLARTPLDVVTEARRGQKFYVLKRRDEIVPNAATERMAA
jgi:hypothetical protein